MKSFIKKSNAKKFGMTIKKIVGRQLLDSRGFPTVEAEVFTNKGSFKAMVASGASTGEFEALELRDGGKVFMGKGVMKAVENINKIIGPALKDKNPEEQFSIDKLMYEQLDGSKNEFGWVKSKLGANSILAVSLAVARAGAFSHDKWLFEYIAQLAGNQHMNKYTLPIPAMNVINGGKHAENTLAFQEFMILPVGCSSFSEAMQSGSEIYHTLKKLIGNKFGRSGTSVGDEGGFAPDINDEIEALDILTEAIDKAGYKNKVKIGIDVAASELWNKEKQIYDLSFKWKEGKRWLTADEMIQNYSELIQKYPIISIEDPLYENDFESWVKLTQQLGDKVQIVGDDLLVTNPSRIQMALDPLACNSLLLKLNQIGTLYESIEACNLAQNNKWNVMVSHRSGETEDHFIADLVVGLNAKQIKTGAPCRSERTAKYNQLLRIEEYLGNQGLYAGNTPFEKYNKN